MLKIITSACYLLLNEDETLENSVTVGLRREANTWLIHTQISPWRPYLEGDLVLLPSPDLQTRVIPSQLPEPLPVHSKQSARHHRWPASQPKHKTGARYLLSENSTGDICKINRLRGSQIFSHQCGSMDCGGACNNRFFRGMPLWCWNTVQTCRPVAAVTRQLHRL